MRFWITKNSELSVREQLVRQVMLAILSEDLPAGEKLPSIRAFARRHSIHYNTVSAAYHDLLDRGWLELRRGSGLYVRPLPSSGAVGGELDAMLADLLRAARAQGYESDQVLSRLEQLILPRNCSGIVIVEPDPGLRQILKAEIEEFVGVPVEAMEPSSLVELSAPGSRLVAALATRAAAVRQRVPRGVPCMTLRLRSVRGSLEGQLRPSPNTLISIVSKSAEFRDYARTMLIAVGLDPECVGQIDAGIRNWQRRASAAPVLVADVVAASALPAGCTARVFRIIADSCIAEMKQLCGDRC